ncbi:MAG: choice-of-anchor V domain-containing protein [Bacteroidia bacterium]
MDYRKLRAWITLFVIFFCFFISLTSYSDGPPEGRTGAPGELTCYNGYCHNSYLVNSGPGLVSLTSSLSEQGYSPGEIYDISVKVIHPGQSAFGFQLLPYSPDSDAGIGQIYETDTVITQLKTDGDRTYIMHDSALFVNDSAIWHFQWQAPPAFAGPVVFYAAFLAADNNGNRSGDYVYKSNWKVDPDPASSLSQPDILPFPFVISGPHGSRQLSWNLPSPSFLEMIWTDISGKEVFSLSTNLSTPVGNMMLSVPGLVSGVYVIRFRIKDRLLVKKQFL